MVVAGTEYIFDRQNSNSQAGERKNEVCTLDKVRLIYDNNLLLIIIIY